MPHHAASQSYESDEDWKAACSTIQASSSGLIVCAAMPEEDAKHVLDLARLWATILADIQSPLRLNPDLLLLMLRTCFKIV